VRLNVVDADDTDASKLKDEDSIGSATIGIRGTHPSFQSPFHAVC
jgi:hypothetical protein